jgi:DNA-directed RNA polymerase beta' subunit
MEIAKQWIVLRELCRKEDFEGNKSPSLVRMSELGVKIGKARNEKYTRNRGLVNEHRTGTISRWTLIC